MTKSPFNLGKHSRATSCKSEEGNEAFRRGLIWCFGFNHAEAVRDFKEAIKLDPEFALGWWGVAYALGPNYNVAKPSEEDAALARDAAAKALALVSSSTTSALPVEIALVRALQQREHAGMTRAHCNKAFADEMRAVMAEFGAHDADVAWVFSEALMNLRPWQLWFGGEPAEEIPELLSTFDTGLALCPHHPGLLHMYVHTMEMCPTPSEALPRTNMLCGLVPDAGHLNHMPSHIYIQLGDYLEAIKVNQVAIKSDDNFLAARGNDNFYTLYRLHNMHMLVWACMFCGKEKLAMETARTIEHNLPEKLLAKMANDLESLLPIVWHVLVRFGRWEEILQSEKLPKNPELRCYSLAVARYARTVALAALRRLEQAQQEFILFVEACANVPASRTLFNNTCNDILAVACAVAEGELAYAQGDYDRAFDGLRRAVVLDDNLPYDEPWGWMMPARHALGALLMEQGHLEEAEQVYRADLRLHPNNVWALHGLAECLLRESCTASEEEKKSVRARLEQMQKIADEPVMSSCSCRGMDRAAKKDV